MQTFAILVPCSFSALEANVHIAESFSTSCSCLMSSKRPHTTLFFEEKNHCFTYTMVLVLFDYNIYFVIFLFLAVLLFLFFGLS